jgi:hypothetical protein
VLRYAVAYTPDGLFHRVDEYVALCGADLSEAQLDPADPPTSPPIRVTQATMDHIVASLLRFPNHRPCGVCQQALRPARFES